MSEKEKKEPPFPEMATYEQIALEVSTLLQQKNAAYGSAFEKTTEILKLLYPKGIPLSAYKNVHVIVRVLDKLSRIAQDNDPFGESPWIDICGYSILAQTELFKERSKLKKQSKD